MMTFYPAIDIKDGSCVRLLRGDMDAATVYGTDPVAQANAFEKAGAGWLHLVDLNGAFSGTPVNDEVVTKVVQAISLPVQLGGGVRDAKTVDLWLERGIARVVLGTVAARNPDFVRESARRHPGKIAVGIDARGGRVAVEGWAETTDLTALELAKRFEDAGVAAIIFTDIDQDGAMQGPNVEATARLRGGAGRGDFGPGDL
jgi:phosphoribosylformimino-5-aminoimidazole carboxamide ribotide isomerase